MFDGNHTRAQAKLVDRMKQLEDRVENASSVVRDLRKRTKELESQDSERHERHVVAIQHLWDRLKEFEPTESERDTETAS